MYQNIQKGRKDAYTLQATAYKKYFMVDNKYYVHE